MFQKRASSAAFFIFLYITVLSSSVTLLYSLFVSPLFHVRSFQIVGICVVFLYSSGLSALYYKRQHAFLAGFLLALYINFIYILISFPFQPGQYLVSFFPWKHIKQQLNQNASFVYLHPLPKLPTPMLLWSLKYTLQGNESLFSSQVPYHVVNDTSTIPTQCKLLPTSLIEIYNCGQL